MLMALARKKVVEVAPVSGGRLALAEVIKDRDSTREVANTCHTALARATTALDAARRTRLAAEDALAEAPAAAKKYMIASARGETVEKPKSLKECRADLEDAQNDFEAATSAVGAMKEEVQKFGDPSFYEQKAKSLAASVIHAAPATAMLIAEAFELRRQLNEKWQMLQWLSELKPFDPAGGRSDVARAVDRIGGRIPSAQDDEDGYVDVRRNGVLAPWAKAFEALLQDAGAAIDLG
jgi:hypothetical protein